MDLRKPLRKEGILSRQLGEESILYDSKNGNVHVINSVAEFVWNMCDGSHSVTDMEQRVREAYQSSGEASILDDLKTIIQDFANLGVVTLEER
ncbi:PqqD family peptide modification chaperone [Candidatus Poribacteria bacterium]|nr:PqqD family peptide modification chaperone [Candidatus Poribacteria bacterium]